MSFTADQFTPTEFSTAEDKARFANQFVKFVSNGYKFADFPKWFYQRLSMCFGHIAHYDRFGFYETFFKSDRGIVEFMRQCRTYPNYGSPTCTFVDVEKALQKWMWSL
jgi:hypothetical protein